MKSLITTLAAFLAMYIIATGQEFQPVSSFLTNGPYGGIPRGNYFIGRDATGLKIIDITDPSQPTTALDFYLGARVSDIQLRGDTLYAGNDRNGLQIFSVSDVLNPQFIGRCDVPGVASEFCLSGDYVYSRGSRIGNNLVIIDVSDPTMPLPITTYFFYTNINEIAASANYLYVSGYTDSTVILDVSDPSNPTVAGGFSTSRTPQSSLIENNILYLPEGDFGIEIYSLQDPINPNLLTRYDTPGYARGISIQGNYAYVADDSLMLVLNISDPANPDFVGSCGGSYSWIIVDGNLAFSGGDLDIIDITNPGSPEVVGSYLSPTIIGKMSVANGRAYALSDYNPFDMDLWVADVSNPASPIVTSQNHMDPPVSNIHAAGNYVFIMAGDSGLFILDVSDPYNPTRISTFNPDESVRDVFVLDNYAYLSTSNPSQLLILDISDRHDPYLAGSYPFTEVLNDVYVEGGYAYVCDADSGLTILNVVEPQSPEFTGYYDIPGIANDCVVDGGYAYMACGTLQIADVSDPANPTFAGSLAIDGGISQLDISGDFVYTMYALWESTFVAAIEITDRANPQLRASYPMPWFIGRGISCEEDYLYASCWSCIIVFRIHRTGVLEEVGTIPRSTHLSACYPNPFNGETLIEYDLASESMVTMEIIDILGRRVETLIQGKQPAGYHQVVWDAGDHSSGIYFYRIQAGDYSQTKKMVLLK